MFTSTAQLYSDFGQVAAWGFPRTRGARGMEESGYLDDYSDDQLHL